MKIDPSETEIAGKWILQCGHVRRDAAADRIQLLVESHLAKIGHDESGWCTLFRDPADGRLWELSYPNSHLHGGGPPTLRVLANDDAIRKYGESAMNGGDCV